LPAIGRGLGLDGNKSPKRILRKTSFALGPVDIKKPGNDPDSDGALLPIA